jgi:hypothetical protein
VRPAAAGPHRRPRTPSLTRRGPLHVAPPSPPLTHPPRPAPRPRSYDRRTGNLQATDLGRIASHYYVTHTTLAAFNDHLKPTMTDIELLRLFALADEFKWAGGWCLGC